MCEGAALLTVVGRFISTAVFASKGLAIVMRHFLFLLLLLSSRTISANGYGIFYQQDTNGYTGPMALLELANNWKGDLQTGDDGVLFHQQEFGLTLNNVSVSYIKRLHAEYQMPYEVAEVFYAFQHDLELSQPLTTNADLKVQDYRGEGFKLQYDFEFDSLTIAPHISWLELDTITWGSWRGDFSYQNRQQWDLNLAVDYYYTEDKLIRRNKSPTRPLNPGTGNLLSLGTEIHWQWHDYKLHYQGENLLARIVWKSLPTTEAKVSTDGAFFIIGYEFDENKQLTPAAHQRLRHSYRLSSLWGVAANSWLNTLRSTHSLGAQFYQPSYQLQLLRQTDANVWTLGLQHKHIQLELQSGHWNVSHSRWLSLSVAAQLNF